MQVDVEHFATRHGLSGEKIIGNIGCMKEDNPFPGTLILTDLRLCFLRSSHIGRQSRFIRLKSIRDITSEVVRSYHCILQVELPAARHRFELHGPSFASKAAFVKLVQDQMHTGADHSLSPSGNIAAELGPGTRNHA